MIEEKEHEDEGEVIGDGTIRRKIVIDP